MTKETVVSDDEYSYHVMCFVCKIIILMALAHGKSRVRVGPITLHTQTSIHVMQLLTKVFVLAFLLNC